MSRKAHWERVYTQKAPETVSWYQPRASVSLRLIELAGVGPGDRIIDVGGGASVLVENLLEAGHREVTVLDLLNNVPPTPAQIRLIARAASLAGPGPRVGRRISAPR